MTQEQAVESLRAVERDRRWTLVGSGPGGAKLINDYLACDETDQNRGNFIGSCVR
jgi:hypothetical protein